MTAGDAKFNISGQFATILTSLVINGILPRYAGPRKCPLKPANSCQPPRRTFYGQGGGEFVRAKMI